MDRQSELLVTWAEMPRSPGHVFYDRLQAELVSAGFDNFVEGQCVPYYAAHRGRPSLPPGRYFRMLLVGYFEGVVAHPRFGIGDRRRSTTLDVTTGSAIQAADGAASRPVLPVA